MKYLNVTHVDQTIGLQNKVDDAISTLYQLYDSEYVTKETKDVIDNFVGDYLMKIQNEIKELQEKDYQGFEQG